MKIVAINESQQKMGNSAKLLHNWVERVNKPRRISGCDRWI